MAIADSTELEEAGPDRGSLSFALPSSAVPARSSVKLLDPKNGGGGGTPGGGGGAMFFGGPLMSADRHRIKTPRPMMTTGQRSRKATRRIPRLPSRNSPPTTTQKIPEL